MASGGSGSAMHVGGEFFKMQTGIDMVHVPYRGGAPALVDLIGGQVQVMFSPLPESIGTIKAGKVRALAVTTAERSQALPDLPTIAETIPGFEASTWQGIGARKGTPAAIVAALKSIRISPRRSPTPGSRSASPRSAASRRRCRPTITTS